MNKVPRPDDTIMIIVLLDTVFLDFLIAVGIVMVMASILFMKKMSDIAHERARVTDIGKVMEGNGNMAHIPAFLKDNVLVKQIEGPLFFGFASGFQHKVSNLSEIKYVIIMMEKVPFIDQTGLYALEESILALEQKGIQVILTGLQQQPEAMLKRIKLIPDLVAEEHLFNTFDESINWMALHKKQELS